MSSRLAMTFCLILAVLFGAISYSAILTKAPIFDEPCHFAAAYAHTFLHDDRSDSENPVLWKSWAMLPIPRGSLQIEENDPAWLNAGKAPGTVKRWYISALFEHGSEKRMSLINRSRFAMMLL